VLTLDASHGEGGGQVLRTALALAVAQGRPVALTRVRAARPRPGLQPQHLTVVRALAAVSGARVEGDRLDSTALTFAPGPVRAGQHRFDVGAITGSAGSVSLLLEALLLPLARAGGRSHLTLVGGTHVPWSPPVHDVSHVFLPVLEHLGLSAGVRLVRWGWYPRGGGEVEATVEPVAGWRGLAWPERSARLQLAGCSAVSRLPAHIAERQRRRALERLAARGLEAEIDLVRDEAAAGPGTCLALWASGDAGRGGASALGRPGLRAEAVADEAADELLRFLDSGAAVDEHLADQLLPFLALADTPSAFTCPRVSGHLEAVAWVVGQFLPAARIEWTDGVPARVHVTPAPRAGAR
jgi:RNA 3'-terminal phosphate cyclase (ATP)